MLRRLSLAAAHTVQSSRTPSAVRFLSTAKDAVDLNPGEEEIKIEIKIEPLPRPGEPTETKRSRLLYQSRKRGILEAELLMSKFAEKHLKDLTREELEDYDRILDEHDWDLYYWASEAEVAPKPVPKWMAESPVFAKIKEVTRNKDRETLRMPNLNK